MFETTIKYLGESDNTKEKLDIVRRMVRDLDKLLNRSSCPLCKQEIDKLEISRAYETFKAMLEPLTTQLLEEKKEYNQRMKPVWEVEKKRSRELEKRGIEYYNLHKKEIDSLIRNYFKIDEISLPSLDERDKKVWNVAVNHAILSKNKDDAEYEELFF
jgi:L-rhamnose mutarotase